MRGLSVIILLLIPAFIALGHDSYLFYENIVVPKGFSLDLLMEEFKLSALGFIWTTYEVESYKATVSSTSPEDWATIDFLLTFKVFYVALGFAGTFVLLFLALKLFGMGPFSDGQRVIHGSGSKKGKKEVSFRSGSQSKKLKYNRK